jgi:hypothetical protein
MKYSSVKNGIIIDFSYYFPQTITISNYISHNYNFNIDTNKKVKLYHLDKIPH